MNYLSDIEIAQSCTMKPITEIAQTAGVDEEYLELYGKYKAKVDYRLLRESKRPDGAGWHDSTGNARKIHYYRIE